MTEEFIKIHYDTHTKIWKSINYPYKHLTNRSVGKAFLHAMRSLDPSKILEYHYDVKGEKRVKDIYQESIIISKNLQNLGVQKGDVIVLISGCNYMTSVLTFGAILMGAIMNFFEVQLENEKIDEMFEILKPSVILYEEVFREKVMKSLERQKPKTLKLTYSIDYPKAPNVLTELLKSTGFIDFDHFQPVAVQNPQSEVAFLVITSGSSGFPKAAQITHSLLLNSVYVWWDNLFRQHPLTSESVMISLSPLRWVSQVSLHLQCAILGVKRICANKVITGSYGLEILRATKPSHVFSAPSVVYDIILEIKEGDFESLKSLKYVLTGGEPNSLALKCLTKKYALNSKLCNSYGMSEVSCSITIDGKLQPGYEMQILDDHLQPVGPNQNGQLAIKAPYPLKLYKGSDNTKYILENGFFLNGDYGHFDGDNTLHLLARYKELVRHQSIALIPKIVESLALKIPGVDHACLVGYRRLLEDPDEVGALFVILKSGVSKDHNNISSEIRDAWRNLLSDDEISLIHDIHFLNSFPVLSCSKINRIALKQLALEREELVGNG